MSKKLLAAALAAAFLATGGIARAGDWNVTGGGSAGTDLKNKPNVGVGTNTNTSIIQGDVGGTAQGIGFVDDATVTNTASGILTVKGGGNTGTKNAASGGLYVGTNNPAFGTLENEGIIRVEGADFSASATDSTGFLLIENGGTIVNENLLILGANSAFGLTSAAGTNVASLTGTTGSIVNSGTVQLDAGIFAGQLFGGVLGTGYLNDGGSSAGDGLNHAFKALMQGQRGNGTDGIGNVTLTGTLANAVILRDPDSVPPTFGDQAYAGEVTLRDTNISDYDNNVGLGGALVVGSNDIDVAGATLNVGSTFGSIVDKANIGEGSFAGRHVNLNEISTYVDVVGSETGYTGDIIAWGSQAGTIPSSGNWLPGSFNELNADGTVTLNAMAPDGTRLRVNGTIYAGSLVVKQSAVLTNNANYYEGGNLDIQGTTTVLTNLITDPDNMDLTGHALTGNGALDNSQGAVTIKGMDSDNKLTSISDTFVIYNATTGGVNGVDGGQIVTNGTGLDLIGQNVKVTTGGASNDITGGVLGGGFGNIDVEDSDITLIKNGGLINWSLAQSGNLTWDTTTPADFQSTFSGTLLLGGGNFTADGDDTKIMAANSTISALNNIIEDGAEDTDFIVREGATLNGGLTVESVGGGSFGQLLNQGTINVGTNTNNIDNELSLWEDSRVINENIMNFGENTVVDTTANAGVNNIDNSKGTIVADGNMDGELRLLSNAIDDLTTDSVGTIQINNTMSSDFDVRNADDGSITLTGNITGKANLLGGEADVTVNLTGKTDAGTITGGSVTVNGDDKGEIGSIRGVAGDVTINSSNKTIADAQAQDGDLYIKGGNNVFTTNDVGAWQVNTDEGGNVYIQGSSNTFKDEVQATVNVEVQSNDNLFEDVVSTVEGDVVASGKNNTFEALVHAFEGSVIVSGTAAFEDGITTDPDENGALVVTSTGTATLGGVINGDIDAWKNSRIEIGADDRDVELNGIYHTDAGSVIEFLKTTNKKTSYAQLHLDDAGGDGETGTLDWDKKMNMYMDGDLARDKNAEYDLITGAVHDEEGLAGNVLLNGSIASTGEIAAFLEDKSVDAFAWSGEYSIDPDDPTRIIYTHILDGSYEQFEKSMGRQDMAGNEGIVSDNTYNALYNTWSNVGASDILALEGLEDPRIGDLAKVLTGAAGQNYWYDLKGNRRAAYAAHQFFNGQDLAGTLEAVQDTVRSFNRAMANRAYNLGSFGGGAVRYDECGQPIDECATFKNRLWAGYTGLWGKNNGRDWNQGYKYDAHGINVGFDHQASSGFGIGAAFGYTKGDYDNYGAISSESKIHNYDFGLYATYNHCSGFFGTLLGSYTYSDYKMNNRFADGSLVTRNTSFSAGFTGWDYAKYHSRTWAFGGKIGYDYKLMANFTITPTLGLYHYRTTTNSFDTSAGRLGMKYSRTITEMPLEVTAKYDIALGNDTTLSLIANAGYAYNFSNKGVSQNSFGIVGDDVNLYGGARYQKPGRSSWNFGGGAQFRYRNVDFGVNYEYYGRRSYKSHGVNANVGVSF